MDHKKGQKTLFLLRFLKLRVTGSIKKNMSRKEAVTKDFSVQSIKEKSVRNGGFRESHKRIKWNQILFNSVMFKQAGLMLLHTKKQKGRAIRPIKSKKKILCSK